MAQAEAANDLGFVHRFVPATKAEGPPVLLLHGTGGDEDDLIPLGEQIAPGAALLSPRGKVLEGSMPRFFRRTADGVWDLGDLEKRTDELADFVTRAVAAYKLSKPVALGYSNGANVAWALIVRHSDLLAGAVLLRAAMQFVPKTSPRFDRIPVLLLNGVTDPYAPREQRDRLAAWLRQAGADVTYETMPAGHGLTERDIDLARTWMAART